VEGLITSDLDIVAIQNGKLIIGGVLPSRPGVYLLQHNLKIQQFQ